MKLKWKSGTVPTATAVFLKCCEEMGYPVAESKKFSDFSVKITSGDTLKVCNKDGKIEITAGNERLARRGIAFALAKLECNDKMPFDNFGIMLDCSRGKVFKVDFLKRHFLEYALAGCTDVMLYTEDTYVLPDEPFWGYMRGGYTLEELQELDAWCSRIGIELSACIQTLGHLEHPLQWEFAYKDISETERILLPSCEKTYTLIDKMIAFWKKALKSPKIHIGMDETHELGRGTSYYTRPGVKPVQLFQEHLARVNEICQKHGYKSPMIWSDMYFRMTGNGDYYSSEKALPKEVTKNIPKNVRLAYWDYYHKEQDFYEKYIDIHRKAAGEPALFSGIWTWAKAWYDHQITSQTAKPGINACIKKNLREIYFTMWGDDGAYCCYKTALAGFCYCADLACGVEKTSRTAKLYNTISGRDYNLTLAISEIEYSMWDDRQFSIMPLLWDDPLYAINLRGLKAAVPDFSKKILARLNKVIKKMPKPSNIYEIDDDDFTLIYTLIKILILKITIREKVEKAYLAKDKTALRAIYDNEYNDFHALLKNEPSSLHFFISKYIHTFRHNWLEYAKPFGLEINEIRNAGLQHRTSEFLARIGELVNGTIDSIPELDASCGPAAMPYQQRLYKKIASGSANK